MACWIKELSLACWKSWRVPYLLQRTHPPAIKAKNFSELHNEIISKYYRPGYDYAAGKLSPDKFWEMVQHDFPQDVFEATQTYILDFEKNETVWTFLPILKKKYRLVLLSDCPEDKARFIRKRANLSFFEKTYFSYEHRLIKEDKEFFDVAINWLGLPAIECLFTDDSKKNVDFAKKIGLQAIQYTNEKELEKFFTQTAQ